MDDAKIDDVLWRRARELAASADGLTIDGLGVVRGGAIAATGGRRWTGYDAPALVVRVADELGVATDVVRSRLAGEVGQAVASANGRPAPLGTLGLIQIDDGRVTFHPARRDGAATADAIDRALTAWRAPAETLGERVDALIAALATVPGAMAPPDLRRLLDELDYDLDAADWRQVGARIVAALPF